MRRSIVLSIGLVATSLSAQDKPVALDTLAIIANIEQRMMIIDHAPINAVYLIFPDQEAAVLLAPDSAVRGNPLERDEIYTDPSGHVWGVGTFLREALVGVTESSTHYFDLDGNTIAATWQMHWKLSKCTDSVAVETRYVYFYPPGEALAEYATLTDSAGRQVDPKACVFPDIERHFDAYYHRDMLLLAKHITLK